MDSIWSLLHIERNDDRPMISLVCTSPFKEFILIGMLFCKTRHAIDISRIVARDRDVILIDHSSGSVMRAN
jgi:hypothetical protein